MDKNKIYLIEWQDAHSHDGWLNDREIENFINNEKAIVRNVGWILSENKDEIVISSEHMKDAGKYNFCEWGNLQKIPKTWIRKRIILK